MEQMKQTLLEALEQEGELAEGGRVGIQPEHGLQPALRLPEKRARGFGHCPEQTADALEEDILHAGMIVDEIVTDAPEAMLRRAGQKRLNGLASLPAGRAPKGGAFLAYALHQLAEAAKCPVQALEEVRVHGRPLAEYGEEPLRDLVPDIQDLRAVYGVGLILHRSSPACHIVLLFL